MATKTRKPLQALGLADNFLFGEVMQDMGLCKLFLEALLQRPIAKIVNISKEKDLSDAYLAHGIRLDVDLEDENRTRYNIEMQGSSQKCSAARATLISVVCPQMPRSPDFRSTAHILGHNVHIFMVYHHYFYLI